MKGPKEDIDDLKQGQKDHEEISTAIKNDLSKLDGISKTTKEILESEKKGEERRALRGRIGRGRGKSYRIKREEGSSLPKY